MKGWSKWVEFGMSFLADKAANRCCGGTVTDCVSFSKDFEKKIELLARFGAMLLAWERRLSIRKSA